MKVTALLPDDLMHELHLKSGAKTITESLKMAITGWLAIEQLTTLNRQLKKQPFRFTKGFSAERIRMINRKP